MAITLMLLDAFPGTVQAGCSCMQLPMNMTVRAPNSKTRQDKTRRDMTIPGLPQTAASRPHHIYEV